MFPKSRIPWRRLQFPWSQTEEVLWHFNMNLCIYDLGLQCTNFFILYLLKRKLVYMYYWLLWFSKFLLYIVHFTPILYHLIPRSYLLTRVLKITFTEANHLRKGQVCSQFLKTWWAIWEQDFCVVFLLGMTMGRVYWKKVIPNHSSGRSHKVACLLKGQEGRMFFSNEGLLQCIQAGKQSLHSSWKS